jgi:hypothetical protein
LSIVGQRQQWRDDYLAALYDLSYGNVQQWTSYREIATQSVIPEGEIMTVGQFITGEGLVELKTFGGSHGRPGGHHHERRRAQLSRLNGVRFPPLGDIRFASWPQQLSLPELVAQSSRSGAACRIGMTAAVGHLEASP